MIDKGPGSRSVSILLKPFTLDRSYYKKLPSYISSESKVWNSVPS